MFPAFLQHFQSQPDEIMNMVKDSVACPVLGTVTEILQAKRNTAGYTWFAEHIFTRKSAVRELVQHPVASRFLETILKTADAQLFSELYSKYLRKKLWKYSCHPVSLYVIQAVIDSCRSRGQWRGIFDELEPNLPGLFERHLLAVVYRLTVAAHKFHSRRKPLFKHIHTLSQAAGQDLVMFLLLQSDGGPGAPKKSQFSYLGSTILQALFTWPAGHLPFLVGSLVGPQVDALVLAKDPSGSRVLEAFLTKKDIEFNSKRKLLKKFRGQWVDLAKDKFGSRTLETAFGCSPLDYKEVIAKELLPVLGELEHSTFGRFVVSKCQLRKYMKGKEQWLQAENKKRTTERLFEDLVKEEENIQKRKSKPGAAGVPAEPSSKRQKTKEKEDGEQEEEEEPKKEHKHKEDKHKHKHKESKHKHKDKKSKHKHKSKEKEEKEANADQKGEDLSFVLQALSVAPKAQARPAFKATPKANTAQRHEAAKAKAQKRKFMMS
jgi:nucleolar protein 9